MAVFTACCTDGTSSTGTSTGSRCGGSTGAGATAPLPASPHCGCAPSCCPFCTANEIVRHCDHVLLIQPKLGTAIVAKGD